MNMERRDNDHFYEHPNDGLVTTKFISVRSVVVEPGFGKRLDKHHVEALAKMLSGSPQLNPISVRTKTGKGYALIAGGDRLAAHMLLGRKTIEARVWNVSDDRAYQLALLENVARRHDPNERAALRQRLLDHYSGQGIPSAPLEVDDYPEPPTQQEVIKKVAEAMNIKPDSVQRAERRARARKAAGDKPPTQRAKESMEGKKPKPINDLGITLSGDFSDLAEKLVASVWSAHELLTRAHIILAKAAKNPLANVPLVLRLHEDLRKVGSAIKASAPASICPYCKVLDGLVDSCGACKGTGLITSEQMAGVPQELLITGHRAKVTYGGRWYTVEEWESTTVSGTEPAPVELDERPPQVDPWEALE